MMESSCDRPVTRGDCLPGGRNAERPCPWVSCKWHLYFDVVGRSPKPKRSKKSSDGPKKSSDGSPTRSKKRPDVPPVVLKVWKMRETCTLDVADRGGQTLEQVGGILGLTRERIRQIESNVGKDARLKKPHRISRRLIIKDLLSESPGGTQYKREENAG